MAHSKMPAQLDRKKDSLSPLFLAGGIIRHWHNEISGQNTHIGSDRTCHVTKMEYYNCARSARRYCFELVDCVFSDYTGGGQPTRNDSVTQITLCCRFSFILYFHLKIKNI